MSVEKIGTAGLRKHPDYIRGQHSKSYVTELATALIDAGKKWIFPPVIVQTIPADHVDRAEGGQYWILDGIHRSGAAAEAELPFVQAEVMSGLSREEGIALQIKTNNSHGLRLSVSAQTNAIKKLAELNMPQVAIAEKTGLHKSSISRILKGTQRAEATGTDDGGEDTAKAEKKPVKKFVPADWMKGLNRTLKAWQKHGTKIRKAGFPDACSKAMDTLSSNLLDKE